MVNVCTFIGNVGKQPEMRFMPNGKPVCKFSIACNEKWRDKDGKLQEKVEWVNIVCFEKLAENCGQYLGKGSKVYVSGKLQTRSYDDKDGNKKYISEIVANNVRFLDGKRDEHQGGGGDAAPGDSEDIPFISAWCGDLEAWSIGRTVA